jgi:signal peptidase II
MSGAESIRVTRGEWLRLLIIIVVTLTADQISKRLIVETMLLGETIRPIPALAPFFQLTFIYNTGSAFGFLPQAGDLFLILAVVIVGALIAFYARIPPGAPRFAVGLVCGGALGNAADRLTYGAVVDFIHYQIPGIISNVSNLADHAIVGGVLIMLIDAQRRPDEKRQPKRIESRSDAGDGRSRAAPPADDTDGTPPTA